MRQNIVYSTRLDCDHCKSKFTVNLYSVDDDFVDKHPELKDEVEYWGKHYHWIDNHRICAKCGKLVEGGNLELVVTGQQDWSINSTYLEWVHKERPSLLIVHKTCTYGEEDE